MSHIYRHRQTPIYPRICTSSAYRISCRIYACRAAAYCADRGAGGEAGLMYLNKTSSNLNPRGEQPQSNLQITTLRSFEGGLNVADTDLNMAPKYAKTLDNIERAPDGSLSVRPGTRLICNSLTSTWESSTTHTSRTHHCGATDGAFTMVDGTSSRQHAVASVRSPWP